MSERDEGWGQGGDAAVDEVWTPTRLNQEVAASVRGLRGLRLRGEVSQPRLSAGHLYFELKDERSKLRAVIWRSTLLRLRVELRDGDQIVCDGDVDVWVQGGTYSLVVQRVERAGVGALFAALQRLRERLRAEGLFDDARKRRLPFLPRRVGIVTALGGAALRDMLRVLHDRFPVAVLVAPAKVQGPGAAQSVAEALRRLDAGGACDVIIIGRGGGSIEDLWAFHEEVVVRAIAACATPVVSAVGHETDTLLSDLVADVRAPTPTAAAELVVPRLDQLQARLRELRRRAAAVVARQLQRDRRLLGSTQRRLSGDRLTAELSAALEALRARLVAAERGACAQRRRRLERLRLRLQRVEPRRRLADAVWRRARLDARLRQALAQAQTARRRRLERAAARLAQVGAAARLLGNPGRRLELLHARLHGLDPRLALARGFAIVRRPGDGAVVRDATDVAPGAALQVLLARGVLEVDVRAVHAAAEASTTAELTTG